MRPWREYEASLNRLYAMEDAARSEEAKAMGGPPPRFRRCSSGGTRTSRWCATSSPAATACTCNRTTGCLRDPGKVIHDTVKWLGLGDAEKAVVAVKPENRTQKRPESTSIEPELATVFDELYAVVDERQPITAALVAKLNETNKVIAPRIAAEQREIQLEMRRRRRPGQPGGEPEDDAEGQPSW